VLPLDVVQGPRHHHLAVKQTVAADLAHLQAKVAVRAIQHRRHTEAKGKGTI
jgi:hypothetical protein